MTPENFKRAWEGGGDTLITFPPEVVNDLRISDVDRAFLLQAGLPDSASPFLDFGGKHYIQIPSAAEVWKSGDAFRRYRIIGTNAFGDPVCIDEESGGAVIYLNHDNEMKRCFMNSNIVCLAYSLLAFRDVVRETQELGGADAFLEGRIPNEVADRFIVRMDEIDSAAIKPDCFWFQSIMREGI